MSLVPEAEIISKANVFDKIDTEKTFLYVDVGGGSTEVSILKDNKRMNSASFKIGTVRLLNNGVENFMWNQLEEWVKSNTKEYSEIFLLGTGGNINKLHKLANIKDYSPITLSAIKQINYDLNKFKYEERILNLGLNPASGSGGA